MATRLERKGLRNLAYAGMGLFVVLLCTGLAGPVASIGKALGWW